MKPHKTKFHVIWPAYLHAILLFPISLLHLQTTNIAAPPTNETDQLALHKFKELQDLLSNNSLTGRIPGKLTNCPELRVTDFTRNKLSGNIPVELGSLKKLVMLQIGGNNLTGDNIGLALPNLKYLSICTNKFFGPIPVSLSNASQLEILALSGNNFVGQVPTDLGNLQHLWWLGVGRNNPGSNSAKDLDFLTSVKNCTKLEMLDFSNNNFGGSLPNSIENLSMQLRALYLDGNKLSGIIPEALENLINLTSLNTARNLFTGGIPSHFTKFQKLEGLALNGNRLSGPLPSSIGNLTQLVKIYLSQNYLEGHIPSSFGNCKYLHTLPVEVGIFKNINQLDVSENKLTGEIPRAISDCLSLEYLYLQEGIFRNASNISVNGNKKLCGGIPELQLQACVIKVMKEGKSHAFKLTVIIVCGNFFIALSSLFLVLYWRRKAKKKSSSTLSSTDLISKFSYKGLYQVTGRFSPDNLIGSGSFGSVYKRIGVLDQ
uniref:Uncharacterized protein n=1 Tax=Quercus lobata TaxID=97700 RepID=A0A7N2N9X7_QUELO